jgi:C1A family cysteine protease
MKVFIIFAFVLVAVHAGPKDPKKCGKGLAIKSDHDCSCAGYEALAKKCKWAANIATCVETSEEYKHFLNKCNRINIFRDGKRNGTIPNTYVREMQCDAYESSELRIKQKTGYVENKNSIKPSKRSLPQYVNNDDTNSYYGIPPILSGPTPPAGFVSLNAPIATSVDWSSRFTPIKNQLTCGSCWIFSAVGLCEWYLKNVKPKAQTILSEQGLVDCFKAGVNTCNGGDTKHALHYIANSGIASSAYAYTATYTAGSCKSPKPYAQAYKCPKPITEFWPSGNDTRLRQIVSTRPVTVSIKVMDDMYQYKTGVYVPLQTCDAKTNHAVILTGFGYDAALKKKFWKFRNSWGTARGEQGYYRMDADKVFQCGISRVFSYYPL